MKEATSNISTQQVAAQLACCDRVREILDRRPGPRLACVDTYGCQQNEADSERLRGFLARMGYGFTEHEEEADFVLLNTCAIREHAEHRVYGNVGALVHTKRRRPQQIVCVAGCMAQMETVAEKLRASFHHVDLVFGPHMLWRFPELVLQVLEDDRRVFETQDEAGSIAEGIPVVRQSSIKAWVSIMYGCNNFCTYCIVPHVRGRERSRAPEIILQEVRELAEAGYQDITLLGQNVNSYGTDWQESYDFSRLLEELCAIPGDFRLHFMTSHPKDAGPRLFDVMAAHPERIAPHLHLPFQSGSSRVLRAMNRGYTREHYLGLIEQLRARMPHIVLTSDVIVGFPGESRAEFEETLSLIQEVEFDALFTFIFSPRVGTPAAQLPDPMPKEEKTKNFQQLLDVQNEISARKHQAYVGRDYLCFVDGQDDRGNLTARTEGGRLVHLEGPQSLIGSRLMLRITSATTWALFGTRTEDAG